MGKRKRNNQQQAVMAAFKKQALPAETIESPYSVVAPEDVEIVVETLQTLAEHPSIIKSKACKDLRTAVFEFRKACTTGVNAAEGNSLTSRISAALTDAKYTDALILLSEMRIRQETPTLGALCRWIRSIDVVSGLSHQDRDLGKVNNGRYANNSALLRVVDAVLRVTGPTDSTRSGSAKRLGPIALQSTWDLRTAKEPSQQLLASIADKSIFKSNPSNIKDSFRILENTPGPRRKPPNMHPAILYASKDDTVLLSNPPQAKCHQHPVLSDLRLIQDVLSPEECRSIVAAGESIEFIPDAPIRDDGSETSILAHNFYWIVDQSFHDKLWQRVKAFVPDSVSGRKVRGINRRFRVYRYVPGAEYRCHIDGAWPPSGIDPVTDAYQYDSSPSDAKQSSLFTFLIYLNDDFKGGETTFFIPSVEEGIINAYPVKPIMGSVAVFPHGEAKGALLHEGTGVTEGAKYVIRTDVEYDVKASQ
ncbi:uncharacterized protein MYCFIDRAFT_81477 [Pseudocercospora fijiensis CIRAD86]|uniref:Fe2OG dioxygenase domain-containing protein n=1 Tax=Pseudocercospora fijiensis (strain CIRAD86) TaxID=383855 RepID=M3AWB0_PSEFD|nr:uncharacterized protein MYCFIDRAFT_81477 [Pseudocercospora fijiensis CIRAD86]EME81423.1 hypothetical protein MYCFIDRAFT_81477 [Pseudocercospora fijiensis CIRAD86]